MSAEFGVGMFIYSMVCFAIGMAIIYIVLNIKNNK